MARSPYRFFCPAIAGDADVMRPSDDPEPLPERLVELPEGESHHLQRVLRLKRGDAVSVFDGKGNAWLARVEAPRGGRAWVALIDRIAEAQSGQAPSSRVHVAASLLKRDAMDWMIEKLCELDVASLQPLVAKRTAALPSKSGDGVAPPPRWEKIALAAAKQSGRNIPMGFGPITPLAAWLARERPPTLCCFAHQDEAAVPLGEWLGGRAGMGLPVQVAVGPEGGWTQAEVELFKKAGFTAVSLGPLVLRAETAAITVAAACRVML